MGCWCIGEFDISYVCCCVFLFSCWVVRDGCVCLLSMMMSPVVPRPSFVVFHTREVEPFSFQQAKSQVAGYLYFEFPEAKKPLIC